MLISNIILHLLLPLLIKEPRQWLLRKAVSTAMKPSATRSLSRMKVPVRCCLSGWADPRAHDLGRAWCSSFGTPSSRLDSLGVNRSADCAASTERTAWYTKCLPRRHALQQSSEVRRRLGEQLAMHVVAAAPLYLERDGVSAEHLEREREILVQRARASGKPDPIVEKMVQGQLTKFYQEVVLLDQPYVVDPEAGAVRKMLAAASKELGAEVALGGFVRYHVGQGEV